MNRTFRQTIRLCYIRFRVLDTSGSIGMVVAISFVPLLVAAGIAVDMAHGVAARAALQILADSAALAGTNAYTDATQSAAAKKAAQVYLDSYAPRYGVTLTGSSIVASPTDYPGYNSVSVGVTATVSTMLLQVVNTNSINVAVKSVAGISPVLAPLTTCGLPTGCPSQLTTAGGVKSNAMDFNAVYMYGVPSNGSGKYDLAKYPATSDLWEIGSNCNGYVDSNWSSQSRCNSMIGARVPTSQSKVFSIPPDQPIAMIFFNQNNGQSPVNSNGYGANQYGLQPGQIAVMSTAGLSMATPASPSSITDDTVQIMASIFGLTIPIQTTNYSNSNSNANLTSNSGIVNWNSSSRGTANNTTLPNCAVQIVLVPDPTNPPSNPPYPGQCLAPNDPRSGYQYANLSCNQIAGRTFMYWWNDLGATKDDLDYKNLYYMLSCQPGVTSTDGGTTAAANAVTHKVAGLLK